MVKPLKLPDYPQSTAHSIIVICHRRTSHLERVLGALSSCSSIEKFHVVFVVQDPIEPVLRIIREFPYSHSILRIDGSFYRSTAQSINGNVFAGLAHCFNELQSKFVIVLEDDIVLSRDALDFFEFTIESQSHFSSFRGVNGFSEIVAPVNASTSSVRVSYGLGWGWAITQKTYSKLCKFWSGKEDNHWDFIIEPYVRTGFVVNPIQSRVLNIGFDESATHTSGDTVLGQSIQSSFLSNAPVSGEQFRILDSDFFWQGKNIKYSQQSRRDLMKNWLIFVSFFVLRDSRIYHRVRRFLQAG